MRKQWMNVLMAVVMIMPFIFSEPVTAQDKKKNKKTETIEIKSSVVCGMCRDKVTKDMAFEKGVTDVKVDTQKQIITVTYKTKKTDKETIKKAITKIGYDADEMMADQEAHDKLPACCQKGNVPH